MKSFFLFISSCLLIACSSLNKDDNKSLSYEDYQLQAANILAQPKYCGDSMLYKMTGADAELKLFYVDTKELYFTCKKEKLTDVLSKIAIHKDSVVVGKQNGPYVELDTKVCRDTSKAFFKFPASNFKIDTKKFIETKYAGAMYRITIPQMVDFVTMHSNLRGGAFAVTPDNKLMVSHGVAVSQKGEPSLKDLAFQLTAYAPTIESKAQRLLDFVSRQIEYNESEATRGETIKRPDEVLFTRNSDCSGKTILYASLLQQINCKWCILYYDHHVCVGVAGNFHPRNASKIELDSTIYYVAETTIPGAVIGENEWGDQLLASELKYYQIPEKGEEIYDYISGKPLPFLKKKVED